MEMELDDRKWTILKAIIQNYLDTGDPVGSRTISKMSDLNLSSATIRNEMSDLEEMGYIIQRAAFPGAYHLHLQPPQKQMAVACHAAFYAAGP